jgi:tetratricopeptide (TPR) repeat protein
MKTIKINKTIKRLALSVWVLFTGLISFSCDDYFDQLPDDRTILDSPTKVRDLLITSYPSANYVMINELSSDNMWDNRVPNAFGVWLRADAFDRMDSNLFEWEDVINADHEEDSPYYVWEQFYQSIAAANAGLEAIEKLKADSLLYIERGEEHYLDNIDAYKGEALALRAYAHFILVNIFAQSYKDSIASKNDLGVTYIMESETVVGAHYERDNVAYVYNQIIKDIEEAIPLIKDEIYNKSASTYHFTKAAAHAFAAKVHLYVRNYDKVIEHADQILGVNTAKNLRDWTSTYSGPEQEALAYYGKSSANLLLLPTFSVQMYRFKGRYDYNKDALKGAFDDFGPTWTDRSAHLGGWVWTFDQKYGLFVGKQYYFFEYTDKTAGIGYPHQMRAEFTTDALLLDRAEAKIFLNDSTAVKDLQLWNQSHKNTKVLTDSIIKDFYTPTATNAKKFFSYPFHTQDMTPNFIVTDQQKPYVDCVLHFRRIERVMEGERWFDIKRYGIELEKTVGVAARKIKLTWDDPHRAIQIPNDVIGAGLTPNPRVGQGALPTMIPIRVDKTVSDKDKENAI